MAELGEGLNGYLDVQDATLRAPRLEAVSNIGIANTAPQHAFSVGSNLYIDTESSNVLTVDGNVVCEGVKVGLIEIVPSYDLAAVSNVGNVTQSTIQFSNATTSFVATANATIGNILTVEGNASINGNLSVTSNLEVGTANLFVDTTNSRVGVGTSIPTESLDVVGNMNLQQVSNTASIKLNSNVVTEFNRSKKLIKYPRVAMSGPSAPTGYVASASRENDGRDAYTAFDGDDTTYWQIVNDPDRYDTSGNATSDATLFEGDNGEWIKILLPDKVKISSIRRRATNSTRRPTNCKLYGSNDNTAWDLLEDITFSNTDWADGNVNTNNYYNYFVLQVLTVSGNGKNVDMKEFELYGTPEYDPEADGVDVVVKSVPNVPNTDWLEVYYDGRETSSYSGSGTTVTDISPNTNNGTLNGGVGFDSTYKAFTFDGTDDYIRATIPGVSDDYIHSISMWVKFTAMNDTVLEISGSTRQSNSIIGVYIDADGTLAYYFYDNDARYHTNLLVNQWYHIGLTYSGSGKRNVYINGIESRFKTSYGDLTQSLTLAGGTMTIGNTIDLGANFFNGSIANFRLFNRALTSDEIWQLYAYQKEYFGHGDLGMTLKAGRLGIGTSEPKAALDVNGTLRVGHDRGASMQTSMVIADGGNVGIGTSNPTSKLHIIDDNADTKVTIRGGGTTVNDSNVTIQLLETAASFYGGMIGYSGTSANQGLRFGHYEVSSTPRIDMAIDRGTGNVGIGTADPRYNLSVTGNIHSEGYNVTNNFGILLESGHPTEVSGETGTCGIGFNTRSRKNHIKGAILATPLSWGRCNIHICTTNALGSGSAEENYVVTEADASLTVLSTGLVGINDTTPSYRLDVNGTLRCFGFTDSSSDDRIKYNEQGVSNALTLISQLNPQKYEKIMERPNPAEGTWIPTDEEWENVKEDYTYGDEYGFIAQDVRNIPELSFLVSGEETRTDTKTSTPEEYSNLTTEEQSTYTISYLHESNVVTQEQYSNLSPEEQEVSVTQYTKQIETQTPLALNYQGLFVVAIGAIKELKAKNESLEARITALENA